MAELWEQLLVHHYDRVQAWVSLWRYPGSGDRVQPGDRDEAVSRAFWKVGVRMLDTFEGDTLLEFQAAAKTAVDFACRDTLRHVATYEKHQAGSIDEPAGDDDVRGRYDAIAADHDDFEAIERAEAAAEAKRRVHYALTALPDNQRRVLLMSMERRSVPDIAAELGTSTDNVHQ